MRAVNGYINWLVLSRQRSDVNPHVVLFWIQNFWANSYGRIYQLCHHCCFGHFWRCRCISDFHLTSRKTGCTLPSVKMVSGILHQNDHRPLYSHPFYPGFIFSWFYFEGYDTNHPTAGSSNLSTSNWFSLCSQRFCWRNSKRTDTVLLGSKWVRYKNNLRHKRG